MSVESTRKLTPAQTAELDRRMATFEEDIKHAISWDELEAKLIARETANSPHSGKPR